MEALEALRQDMETQRTDALANLRAEMNEQHAQDLASKLQQQHADDLAVALEEKVNSVILGIRMSEGWVRGQFCVFLRDALHVLIFSVM